MRFRSRYVGIYLILALRCFARIRGTEMTNLLRDERMSSSTDCGATSQASLNGRAGPFTTFVKNGCEKAKLQDPIH